MSESRPDGGTETRHLRLDTERSARDRLRSIADFATREYRLAVRSNWASGLALLFAALSIGVVTFSRSALGTDGVRAVVLSVAELSVYLVPLAALAFGYGVIVEPRQRGSLDLLLALPVPRWVIAVGIYLGRAAALASALVVGFGAGGLALFRFGGGAGWEIYLAFVAAAVAAGAAFLAIGLVVSTLAREKSHALGGVLLAWVWFVLLFDLLALGAVVGFDLPTAALVALLCANPATLFRLLVLSVAGSVSGGFGAVLASVPLGTASLAAALVAWTIVPVAAAAALLGRR